MALRSGVDKRGEKERVPCVLRHSIVMMPGAAPAQTLQAFYAGENARVIWRTRCDCASGCCGGGSDLWFSLWTGTEAGLV